MTHPLHRGRQSNPQRAAAARARRLAEGERMRTRERESFTQRYHVPTHKQLLLPLLENLLAHGGQATPQDLYEPVADQTHIDPEARQDMQTFANGRRCNLWHRHLRWTRQTAIEQGLIASAGRGTWAITDAGRSLLRNIRRGVVITLYTTDAGLCLWANAEDAAAVIKPESIDLLLTSPPYPLITDSRGYGTMDPASWVDWMTDLGHAWKELLKDTGSLIVHLGDVWYRGTPTQSPYIERFLIRMLDTVGFHLAERLYAEHPSRLPIPRPWVAIRRVRVKSTIDPVLWLAKSPNPKASHRDLLVPYRPETHTRYLGRTDYGGLRRPGGQTIGRGSFARDNGGSIPGNVIRCTGRDTEVQVYRRACVAAGRTVHPAIMPRALARYATLLTTEKEDLVYDPFFGSGTVGDVAEALGRRWIGSERSREYVEGSALRFHTRPGFTLLCA